MKKVILQILVVLVGLSGLKAGMFSNCTKSLVGKVQKPNASVTDQTKFRKCVNPKMAQENPNFTQALIKACDSASFKKKFSKQCVEARKAENPDEEDHSSDDSSSNSSGSNGGSSSDSQDSSSSGGTTCTCICPGAQAQGYAPQPQPGYDPYGGYQQQQMMQQYPQQYPQPGYGY